MMMWSYQSLLELLELFGEFFLIWQLNKGKRLITIMQRKFFQCFNSSVLVESMHDRFLSIEIKLQWNEAQWRIVHDTILHAENLWIDIWAVDRGNVDIFFVLGMEIFPYRFKILTVVTPWGIKVEEPGSIKNQFVGICINHVVVEVVFIEQQWFLAICNFFLTFRKSHIFQRHKTAWIARNLGHIK